MRTDNPIGRAILTGRKIAILVILNIMVSAVGLTVTAVPFDVGGPSALDTGAQFGPELDASRTNISNQGSSRSDSASGTYRGMAIGDIDRDGDLDLISVGDGGVEAWAGNGAGMWTDKADPTASGKYFDVALSDFDHDGDLDVVAAGDSGVKFWTGDGAWTWSSGTDPVASGAYYAVEVADLNIDGNPDIVAGGQAGIQVRLGDGSGGWTSGNDPISTDTHYAIAIGDFDIDGNLDIASAGNDSALNNGTVKTFPGDGAGGWSSATTLASGIEGPFFSLDTDDVDRDGDLDLVGGRDGGIHYWTGDGANSWTAGTAPTTSSDLIHRALLLKDLDQDGKVDIVAGNQNGTMVWLGDGGASWPTVPAKPVHNMSVLAMAIGDLDHDSKPDVAAGLNGSGFIHWINDVADVTLTGWTLASTNLMNTGRWADIDFGDVDHDGDLDLIVTSYQGQNQGIRVYTGNGAGTWTASSTGLPNNNEFSGVRFADYDHDGNLDIIATEDDGWTASSTIRVWSGDGTGSWTSGTNIASISGAGLEIGDLNNDGNLDAVTGYWTGNFGPTVYRGNGDLSFQADSGPASTVNVDDVTIGDVNNDGSLDFGASTMNGAGVQFWVGDGTGGPSSWTREDTGLPNSAVFLGLATGDVDNDGDLDVAAAGFSASANGCHLYLGDGGSGGSVDWTEASTGLPSSGQFSPAEFADIDLDGNLDFLTGNVNNSGPDGLHLYSGDGGAGGSLDWTEIGKAPFPSNVKVWGARFGDINNDGILDIAATPDGSGVRVWTTDRQQVTYFDHVTIAPASGDLETGETLEFTAQAYDIGDNPVSGIEYVWEVENTIGTIDFVDRKTINLTGTAGGTGKLKVTAMQGLFSKGDAIDITVTVPPPPKDLTVQNEASVGPDTIWMNGTNLTDHQENATIKVQVTALGGNVTVSDQLVVNLTLAKDIDLVDGTFNLTPNSTVRNANGTTSLRWNIGELENTTTLSLNFEILSNIEGDLVVLNDVDISDVRFLNLSGPQVIKLDELSVTVLAIQRDVPGPPLNLTARPGNSFVDLAWEPPTFNGNSSITGYMVYRGEVLGSETLIQEIGNLTRFNDTNISNEVTYYYKVKAENSVGQGPFSNIVEAKPSALIGPPSSPLNLTASAGNAFVDLRWEVPLDDGGSEIIGYKLYRGTAAGAGQLLVEVTGPTYNDTSVTNNVTYYYSVGARNAYAEGPVTPEVEATPSTVPPPPPIYLPSVPMDLVVTAGNKLVTLSWEPPEDDGGSPITGYTIKRGTEPGKGAVIQDLVHGLTFEDTNVTNGVTYQYRVAAVNQAGTGPYTVEVAAQPWALPSAPRNVKAVVFDQNQVRLNWDLPESDGGFPITGYKVFRAETETGPQTELGAVADRTFLDPTVKEGKTYWYSVKAHTEKGESPLSEKTSIEVPKEADQPDQPGTSNLLSPFQLILIIVIIAVMVAVVILMARRRKSRPGAMPSREAGPPPGQLQQVDLVSQQPLDEPQPEPLEGPPTENKETPSTPPSEPPPEDPPLATPTGLTQTEGTEHAGQEEPLNGPQDTAGHGPPEPTDEQMAAEGDMEVKEGPKDLDEILARLDDTEPNNK